MAFLQVLRGITPGVLRPTDFHQTDARLDEIDMILHRLRDVVPDSVSSSLVDREAKSLLATGNVRPAGSRMVVKVVFRAQEIFDLAGSRIELQPLLVG